MRTFARRPLVWVCFVILPACGKPNHAEKSQTKAIIDEDSLRPVTQPQDVPSGLPVQAIGRMTGGCTAFHLGNGLVATAGHCLPRPKDKLEETPCHTYAIQWAETRTTSRCLRYKAYRFDADADYALLQVDPAPDARLNLMSDRQEALTPREAVVIGFPKDRELSHSGQCHIRWDRGTEATKFYHTCDTLPGNSGSPVVDRATAQVIGVHDGDADLENYGSFLPPLSLIEALMEESADSRGHWPAPMRFGPFKDREERVLTVISSQRAPRVAIDLSYDLEDTYDKLVVVDGQGRRHEMTGRREQTLELPTPLVMVIVTDYSGTSEAVHLRSLRPIETH